MHYKKQKSSGSHNNASGSQRIPGGFKADPTQAPFNSISFWTSFFMSCTCCFTSILSSAELLAQIAWWFLLSLQLHHRRPAQCRSGSCRRAVVGSCALWHPIVAALPVVRPSISSMVCWTASVCLCRHCVRRPWTRLPLRRSSAP